MPDIKAPEVWVLAYDQLPTIMRWVLGIFSVGAISLASLVYSLHREARERDRIQHRTDIKQINEAITHMSDRMDGLNTQMQRNHEQVHMLFIEHPGKHLDES